MVALIKGNRDGENGRNETYSVPGRGARISRSVLVKDVGAGKYPGYRIYKRNGEKYVRGRADGLEENNVNGEAKKKK